MSVDYVFSMVFIFNDLTPFIGLLVRKKARKRLETISIIYRKHFILSLYVQHIRLYANPDRKFIRSLIKCYFVFLRIENMSF